ncbi:hypothetical protein H0H93_005881 [Arthromyces matolae]|nr:hypothetical protein H0H93_005881 [Arthromyces matolae]
MPRLRCLHVRSYGEPDTFLMASMFAHPDLPHLNISFVTFWVERPIYLIVHTLCNLRTLRLSGNSLGDVILIIQSLPHLPILESVCVKQFHALPFIIFLLMRFPTLEAIEVHHSGFRHPPDESTDFPVVNGDLPLLRTLAFTATVDVAFRFIAHAQFPRQVEHLTVTLMAPHGRYEDAAAFTKATVENLVGLLSDHGLSRLRDLTVWFDGNKDSTMSTTPDYSKPPYSHWAKCPHTCPHTNTTTGSRRAAHLRTLVFDHDGVPTAALQADYIHPFSAPSLAMHACLKSKHEFCNKDNCAWTHIISDDNKPLPNGTTSQIRQSLTAENWRKHGVAMAILYSDHSNFPQVPVEYYDRALPILQQHLTPERYNAVLEKRNPRVKGRSGLRIVGDDIIGSTARPSGTSHGNNPPPPPPPQQNDGNRPASHSPAPSIPPDDRDTNPNPRRSHSPAPPPQQNDGNRPASHSPAPSIPPDDRDTNPNPRRSHSPAPPPQQNDGNRPASHSPAPSIPPDDRDTNPNPRRSHSPAPPPQQNDGNRPASHSPAPPQQDGGDYRSSKPTPLAQRIDNFYDQAVPHEMSPHTPKLTWSNGLVTPGPFIPNSLDETNNVIIRQFEVVQQMSQWPNSKDSDLVVHLDYNKYNDLKLLAADCVGNLKVCKTVVVENYPTDAEVDFENCLLPFPSLNKTAVSYTVHDALKRAADHQDQTTQMTLNQFMQNTTDHRKVQSILSLVLGHPDIPPLFRFIDDGLNQYTNNISIFQDAMRSNIYTSAEVYTTLDWALLHHGGVFTDVHHDADGLGTHTRILTGSKQWTIIYPEGWEEAESREDLNEIHENMSRLGPEADIDSGVSYDRIWRKGRGLKAAVIDCQPGDMIIMPPGALHQVFTPIRTFARGGHYTSYHTLHLCEMSRAIDRIQGFRLTNDLHSTQYQVLCAMMISVVNGLEFSLHLKCLQALCRMILHYEEYIPATGMAQHTKAMKKIAREHPVSVQANTYAARLAKGMEWDFKEEDYLFQGDYPWYHPGPLVSSELLSSIFHPTDEALETNKRNTGPTQTDLPASKRRRIQKR